MKPRPVVLAWWIWGAVIAGVIVLALPGCAAPAAGMPANGMCAFLPIGQNESGVTFVRYECKADET